MTHLILALLASAAGTYPVIAQAAAPEQDTLSEGEQGETPQGNDIIVTAQRRSERLKDVPISITALTPETLRDAGVQTTRDLSLVTPGLRIETVGVYVQPALRGITTQFTSPAADANVATYLDGVYQQSTIGAIYELPDIQQIEVLKGPQGTLFGRNATGGAILVTTANPDLNRVTGRVSASYSRFISANAGGYVSVPLVEDRLAISVTGYVNHEGAFNRDLLRGGKRRGEIDTVLIRGKIRFVPWAGADFVLSGMYSRRRDEMALEYTNLNGNNAANRNPLLTPVVIASRPYEFASDVNNLLIAKTKSGNLRGTIEVGPGSLQTTTAYTDVSVYIEIDGDNSPRPSSYYIIPSFSRTFTQELVYSTKKLGRFSGTLGGFYYSNDAGFNPLNVNNFTQAIYTKDTSRAWAIFGEVNLDLTDRLSMIGGLRYSHERRTAAAAFVTNTSVKPTLNPLGAATFKSSTPRLSLLYRISDDANVYFTYSKGFKSGAFNSSGFQTTPVQPEKVTAYEVGVKASPLPGVTLNVAGFYYDYTDLQVASTQTVNNTFRQTLENAATARIYGIELSGNYRVSENLRLSAGGTWLNAKYLSFPTATVNIVNPDGLGGNLMVPKDVSGNQMVRAPEFSGYMSSTLSVPVSVGRVEVSGTLFYSTKVYHDVLNRIEQPAYTTINAKLTWKPRDGIELSVFGRNLTNNVVIGTTTITSTYDGVNYLPPRTYGVQAFYAF